MERIVLAYSGGLDTSVAIAWLAETRGAEVIAVTLDLGSVQGLDLLKDKSVSGQAELAGRDVMIVEIA